MSMTSEEIRLRLIVLSELEENGYFKGFGVFDENDYYSRKQKLKRKLVEEDLQDIISENQGEIF